MHRFFTHILSCIVSVIQMNCSLGLQAAAGCGLAGRFATEVLYRLSKISTHAVIIFNLAHLPIASMITVEVSFLFVVRVKIISFFIIPYTVEVTQDGYRLLVQLCQPYHAVIS